MSCHDQRVEFEVDVWVTTTNERVDADNVRSYAKGKDASVMLAVFERSPSLWVGTTQVPLPDNETTRGPVGRVFDTLTRSIGPPDWALPTLTPELRDELRAGLAARPEDPPYRAVAPEEFARFLNDHIGAYVFQWSRPLE